MINLREAILAEHSRPQTLKIAHWIGNEPQKVRQLITILLEDEYRVVQRAAWVVSVVAEQHPSVITPYVPLLVAKLKDPEQHVAVKRNIYRMLQFLALPEPIHGDLIHLCFESLLQPGEALAVRAFAISILARMFGIYPELGNELRLILEDALQHETAPSFKSRAKKILKELDKRF